MSFDLAELVGDQLNGPLAARVASLLGDAPGAPDDVAGAAVAALLEGVVRSAGTPGGADALYAVVQAQDDALLDDVPARLDGDGPGTLEAIGGSELAALFGAGGTGALGGALAGYGGVNEDDAGRALALLAPIAFGVIKRKVMNGGLNAGGLATMLHGQKARVDAALPAGLRDELVARGFVGRLDPPTVSDARAAIRDERASGTAGSGGRAPSGADPDVPGGAGTVSEPRRPAPDTGGADENSTAARAVDVKSAGGDIGRVDRSGNPDDNSWSGWSMWKKLLPIVGILLLGWIVLNLFNTGDEAPDTVAVTEPETPDVVTAVDTDAADTDADAVAVVEPEAPDAVTAVDTDAADTDAAVVAVEPEAPDAVTAVDADAAVADADAEVADAADATEAAAEDAGDAVADAADAAADGTADAGRRHRRRARRCG